MKKILVLLSFTILTAVLFNGCAAKPGDVDTAPPKVILQSPESGAEDIPINSTVTAKFDKSVVGILASTTTFTLQKLGSFGSMPAAVSYDDITFTATLDPENDFEADSVYIVTITNDVKSRTGIEMVPVSWAFSTSPLSDTTPPAIVSKTPDADAKYILTDMKVNVEFSEALQATSIVSQNFYLMKGAVKIPSTLSTAGNKVTLTPDAVLEDWTDYTVVITDGIKDIAGNSLTQIMWSFKTDDQNAPVIVSRVPASGESSVAPNTVITVVFSESVRSNTIQNTGTSFILKKNFGDFTQIPASVVYNDITRTATLTPGVTLESGSTYRVDLTDAIKDAAYNPLASLNWTFTTSSTPDTTPPAVIFRNPESNNIKIETNTTIVVRFDENVNGINSSNFTLKKTSGDDVVSVISYNTSTKTATLTPSKLLRQGTDYTITLTTGVKDNSGNSLPLTLWSFVTADNTRPVVDSTTPKAVGEVGVNTSVYVNFSEKILPSSLSVSTFKVETEGGAVSGEVSSYTALVDDKDNENEKKEITVAVFKPDVNLQFSKAYTVTLTNGITDLFNNNLNTMSWTFNTGTAPDTTAPVVAAQYPAKNATGVSVNAGVTVTFSESVSGVSASNVTLKFSGATVAAQMNYDPLNFTATILPDKPLQYNTTYTVAVTGTGVIKDAAGNFFAADEQWTFLTAPDSTPPVVIHKIPDPGMPDIPGNTLEVTALFSENVTGVGSSTMRLRRDSDSSYITCNVTYTSNTLTNTYKAVLVPASAISVPGNYSIEMTNGIKDAAGNSVTAPVGWTFGITTVDDAPPVVMVTTPNQSGTDRWENKKIQVIFNEDVKNISSASFYVVKASGGTPLSSVVSYERGLLTAELVTDAVLEVNTEYRAYLTSAVTDRAGNPLVPLSWVFITNPDTTPPTVVAGSYTPPNGTNGVPIGSSISATFDEALQVLPDWSGSFYLFPARTGTINYDPGSKTLTLTPAGGLAGNTDYTVYLNGGIKDAAGNSLANISWQFRTQDIQDETPPEILSVTDGAGNPLDGQTGIDRETNIIVTFSEDVTNAPSRIVLRANGTPVSASITYSNTSGSYRAVIDPTGILAHNTPHTVTVMGGATGLMDTSNNRLAADHITLFSSASDITPPQILASYPVVGSSNLNFPLKPTMTFSFNEPVTGVSSTTVALYEGLHPDGVLQNTYYVTYDETQKLWTLVPNITTNTNGNLVNNTQYYVRLNRTGGLRDLAGNPLAETIINFTTASLPVVSSSVPAMNATGVSTDLSSVSITFNQPMNPLKSWVEITDNSGSGAYPPVSPGAVTWSAATYINDTANIQLIGKLRAGAVYTVKLYGWGGTFEDLNGNMLDRGTYISNGRLTFTAGADNADPNFISTFPFYHDTDVNVNIPVVFVRFTEPMDPSAGTATLSGIEFTNRIWAEGNRQVSFNIPKLNGTGYTTGIKNTTTSGSGSGCTVNITSVGPGGCIAAAALSAQGTGYRVGDILYITDAAGSGGTCIVTAAGTVAQNRRVTAIALGAGTLDLPVNTLLTVTLNGFTDISGRGLGLGGNSFSFTTGTSTSVEELFANVNPSGSFDGESFEHGSGYTDFDIFRNVFFVNIDPPVNQTPPYPYPVSRDWLKTTWASAYPNYALAVPSGQYIAKASDCFWEFGDYADIELVGSVALTETACYILSFQMIHERIYNRTDRVEVHISTNGGLSYTRLNAGSLNAVYRYDYSLADNNPVWKTHYFNLSGYSGNSSVKIVLRSFSAGETGGNIYIDDVRITKY